VEPDDEDLWALFSDSRQRSARQDREERIHRTVTDRLDRGHSPPRRAQALSRDEIVRAAIAVADAEGAEAVSMRRIARELRAGTMSLYWHVASKDELLDLMLDAVEGEQRAPEPTGDWRSDLRAIAENSRAVLHRHQWLMDFIGGRPPLGPNTLRNLERSLGTMDTLGLDTATAFYILSTVATYVMGTVLREFRESRVEHRDEARWGHLSQDERDKILASHVDRLRQTGRFPHFVRIFDEDIDPDAEETRDERFEFGLRCVLDGIAVLLAAPAGEAPVGEAQPGEAQPGEVGGPTAS
jgi:AcrR family transcriptional regulator